MNKFLAILFLVPVMIFSMTSTQKSKVFVEEVLFKKSSLKENDVTYSLLDEKVLDSELQTYFVISFKTWVDQSIYFKKEHVEELVDAIAIYRAEKTNLIKANNFISYYLGFVEGAYISESVSGMGKQYVIAPQIDFSVHFENNKFYLKLAPVDKKSDKNKDVIVKEFYLSEEQLKTFEEFLDFTLKNF